MAKRIQNNNQAPLLVMSCLELVITHNAKNPWGYSLGRIKLHKTWSVEMISVKLYALRILVWDY